MSALGQKRTFCGAIIMSVLPPKADILRDNPRPSICDLVGRQSRYQSKSHSFSIARTTVRSVFTKFFSRRNLVTGPSTVELKAD